MGVQGSSGFISFQVVQKSGGSKFQVGQLLDVAVVKMSSNGRICTVTADPKVIQSSSVSLETRVLGCSLPFSNFQVKEVNNVTSVLPGTLGQALITAMSSGGLNLQLLGFFDATADEFHVPANPDTPFKIGQKVKARILYEIPGNSPPRFSVSLLDHIINMEEKLATQDMSDHIAVPLAFPIGTILNGVRVKRVESERGLIVEVQPHLDGFIHVRVYINRLSQINPAIFVDISHVR